jgi:hypothetical protein
MLSQTDGIVSQTDRAVSQTDRVVDSMLSDLLLQEVPSIPACD